MSLSPTDVEAQLREAAAAVDLKLQGQLPAGGSPIAAQLPLQTPP